MNVCLHFSFARYFLLDRMKCQAWHLFFFDYGIVRHYYFQLMSAVPFRACQLADDHKHTQHDQSRGIAVRRVVHQLRMLGVQWPPGPVRLSTANTSLLPSP